MAGADAFADVSGNVGISGGPRRTAATRDYSMPIMASMQPNPPPPASATMIRMAAFTPVGFGAAITWAATDRLETIA